MAGRLTAMRRRVEQRRPRGAPPAGDDGRRRQLIEMTIDSLAEVGFVGTTLAEIAGRASVSAGLVAHYFGDKNGLLEAAFRSLTRQLGRSVTARLVAAASPRERLQAIIDANLAPEEFDHRTGTVWLAFWGQVLYIPELRRVQHVYQRRMISNLRHALRALVPAEASIEFAAMIAAMIDGVWLRGALSAGEEIDSTRARAMVTAFVDSHLRSLAKVPPEAAPPCEVIARNPATGTTIARLPVTSAGEIDAMVARAAVAQRAWAVTPPIERGRILRRAADLLRSRNRELAELETRNTGKPIQETEVVDVQSGADCLEYFAGVAPTIAGQHLDLGPGAFGYTRREPIGVIAGIGAWNYPLQIACWKAAPALACGNAMIFKPSELTPLSAICLTDIFAEAGLPDGVFQVAQGHAATGRRLAAHPGIGKVSLTGSLATGGAVMAAAAENGPRAVTLELGGKSPLVVFGDADLDDAVSAAMLANFYSSGQVCSNGTRVFVERALMPRFIEALLARTARLIVGDPLDPATQIGPLVSERQLGSVLAHIERAKAEGVRLLHGGRRLTEGSLAEGWFVEPTIFAADDDTPAIVRDEVFGPVLTLLAFDDEAEVIARANASRYGLAAGVFTRDLTRAHRMIAALEAGTTWINQYNITPVELPFGGVKQSGLGRENGLAAIDYYTQVKSVYVAMAGVDCPY